MSNFRIALVQPLTSPPPVDETNVAVAIGWIECAVSQGAAYKPELYESFRPRLGQRRAAE